MIKKKETSKQKTPRKEPSTQKEKLSFFPKGTPREDKISLLSFCLGMIVMACFFVIDLQIRNHLEMNRLNNQLKITTYQLRSARSVALAHHRQADRICGCNKKSCQKIHRRKSAVKCPPIWQRQVPFNPQQYAPYDFAGTLKITGNVCEILPKGVTCPEKIDVFVNPKTDYSDEWWTKHWAGTNGISKTDERALKYNKKGSVQKDGSFEITQLPTGTYYVGAAMCIATTPGHPCKPIRLGAEIKLDKNMTVSLKQVFPVKK